MKALRFGWTHRLLSAAFLVFILFVRPEPFHLLRDSSLWLQIGSLIVYPISVLALLHAWVRKTLVSPTSISQRSALGRWTVVPYEHLLEVVLYPGERLVWKHQKGQIVLWAIEGRIEELAILTAERAGKRVQSGRG